MLGTSTILRKARAAIRYARLSPALCRAFSQAWTNPPAFPKVLQIEHTTRCNLKCVMCVHGNPNRVIPKRDMPYDLFVSVLGQFKGTPAPPEFGGLQVISLHGAGEPMLHRDLIAMLELAQKNSVLTSFVTNMTALTGWFV